MNSTVTSYSLQVPNDQLPCTALIDPTLLQNSWRLWQIDLLLSKSIPTVNVWGCALALVLYVLAECGKNEILGACADQSEIQLLQKSLHDSDLSVVEFSGTYQLWPSICHNYTTTNRLSHDSLFVFQLDHFISLSLLWHTGRGPWGLNSYRSPTYLSFQ